MNNDLISRSALLKFWFEIRDRCVPELVVDCMIKEAPSVDAVSPGVLEQYKWERDTAIAQLEELGIGFGQKKPDMVEVVRCKECESWNKCSDELYIQIGICEKLKRYAPGSFYCADGVKRDLMEVEHAAD